MQDRPPSSICEALHTQLGAEEAEKMIADWMEHASGSSSFPRIDPVQLELWLPDPTSQSNGQTR